VVIRVEIIHVGVEDADMKLSITPCPEYPRHELFIEDWLAKEKEILNRHKQEICILKESAKRIDKKGNPNHGAYYIKFVNGVQEEHWIPKSHSKIIERKETSIFTF